MSMLGRGVRKATFWATFAACATMGVDAAVSLAQFPFVEKDCPQPKIAMMTNMAGIFTNLADPHILDADYLTPELNAERHERFAEEMPAKVVDCYKVMPSSGLVWLAQQYKKG